MIAVFLFLKPYRQTHVYRASRAERGEVIVPGAVIFLVEDILDTYARFQNHGLQIEGVAGIQIPLLEFGSVTVRLRVAFALQVTVQVYVQAVEAPGVFPLAVDVPHVPDAFVYG